MLSMEVKTECAWIPGLAVLARNDGHVVCVIPAQAGIQGAVAEHFVSEQCSEVIFAERGIASSSAIPRNDI